VHRGIEKGVEGQNWAQAMYMLERICGICSHVHATAYTLGVEALAGVQVPPRAQAIRELVAELERVHSHLLWLGVAAHEGGFDTLFMYSWRDREVIMDVLEGLTGNRVNYSCNVLGGVKFDVDQKQADAIRQAVDLLEPRTHHYLKVVTTDETLIGRTRNVGKMTADEAEKLGAVGPTARASGVARDIRVDSPYAAYSDFPVKTITATAGDLEAKFIVRLQELFESYRVIREILDHLPTGGLTVRVKPKVPPGETISRVEAPRGELLYYIKSAGGASPDRVKVRTPSLCNWGSVISTAPGHKLADVPMLIAGIDPCFSCNDRIVTIRRRDDAETWTWARLRQYGIEYYR
jgi:NADH-quinone oxidoreductase subunit D